MLLRNGLHGGRHRGRAIVAVATIRKGPGAAMLLAGTCNTRNELCEACPAIVGYHHTLAGEGILGIQARNISQQLYIWAIGGCLMRRGRGGEQVREQGGDWGKRVGKQGGCCS